MNRIALALAALAAVAGCDPLTIERELSGVNASNKPGLVFLDPRTIYRAAVWAQEAYEAAYKMDPVQLYEVRNDIGERREMEVIGHEIEVQAAVRLYEVDEDSYRNSEARAMQVGYGGMFGGWPVSRIEAEMKKKTAFAKRWVERNYDEIEDQQ